MNDVADFKESKDIPVAAWKANSILIALITMVGVVAASYNNNRPTVDAPDRYTGTQGIAHEARTTLIEHGLLELANAVDTLQLQVAAVEQYGLECKEWRDGHSVDWHEHEIYSRKTVNQVTNNITRLQVKVELLKDTVRECIKRTQ